jgi:DNA-binding GntR family transcriptional regulator
LPRSQTTKPDPAPARLLKQQAYQALKECIVACEYPPGTFLSERLLTERLRMSKTPIRSALELLEAEGYVAVAPRQGIVVREPSLSEIADQFEIRLALEGYVLRKLAGRLTLDQVREIRDSIHAQRRAAQAEDLPQSVRLDRDFHLLFCHLVGNQEVLRVMTQLREKMTWMMRLVFQQSAGRMLPNWKEHRLIAEAVIAGDGDRAVRRLAVHLEFGKRALLRSGPHEERGSETAKASHARSRS